MTTPPRRRPRMAHVSLREAREIYQVRVHLYALVSELIVAQASDQAIQLLRAQLARLEAAAQAGDRDAYFWEHLSFRATEVEICGNVQLQRLLDSLGLRTLQARHQSLTSPGRMERSLHDHARLICAYTADGLIRSEDILPGLEMKYQLLLFFLYEMFRLLHDLLTF